MNWWISSGAERLVDAVHPAGLKLTVCALDENLRHVASAAGLLGGINSSSEGYRSLCTRKALVAEADAPSLTVSGDVIISSDHTLYSHSADINFALDITRVESNREVFA